MALQVELVSPERILYSGEAEMVVCRTSDGEIAFMTGHAPFLGALDIAIVRIHQVGGATVRAAVHGGFVQVKDDRVIVLSDVAELPDQIDAGRARAAVEEAERAVREAGGDVEAAAEADTRLRRARTRVELVGS